MKAQPQNSILLSFLSGRLMRNVYFWVLVLWTRSDYSYSSIEVLFTVLLMAVLMLLFYVNNLLLIPQFLDTKKYKEYLAAYTALVGFSSFLYVLTYKLMLSFFPGNFMWKISPLQSSKETGTLSFEAFLHEMPAFFAILFIAGTMFAMSWYVMNYQRQQKVLETIKKKHLESELNFLKSQINPHFLFNTMNNLYTLTIKKSDEAPEVVSRLSSILRYLLYESNIPLVHFDKEKEIMQAYINLEALRLTDNRNITVDISSDRDYLIPPLLWVPVLENAFKFGTGFIGDGFFIDFRFLIANNILTIYSRNKFKLTEKILRDTDKGIGLANLQKRLELLFPGKFTAEINTEDYFYTIHIQIRLN